MKQVISNNQGGLSQNNHTQFGEPRYSPPVNISLSHSLQKNDHLFFEKKASLPFQKANNSSSVPKKQSDSKTSPFYQNLSDTLFGPDPTTNHQSSFIKTGKLPSFLLNIPNDSTEKRGSFFQLNLSQNLPQNSIVNGFINKSAEQQRSIISGQGQVELKNYMVPMSGIKQAAKNHKRDNSLPTKMSSLKSQQKSNSMLPVIVNNNQQETSPMKSHVFKEDMQIVPKSHSVVNNNTSAMLLSKVSNQPSSNQSEIILERDELAQLRGQGKDLMMKANVVYGPQAEFRAAQQFNAAKYSNQTPSTSFVNSSALTEDISSVQSLMIGGSSFKGNSNKSYIAYQQQSVINPYKQQSLINQSFQQQNKQIQSSDFGKNGSSKIFRIKRQQQQAEKSQSPDIDIRNHNNSSTYIDILDQSNFDILQNQTFNQTRISLKSPVTPPHNNNNSNNGRSQSSSFRRREKAISTDLVNQNRSSENHINKLLELINVHNIVGSAGHQGPSKLPQPNPQSNYAGVFIGDGVTNQVSVISGSQQKQRAGDITQISPERFRKSAVEQSQSIEPRDSQMSQYHQVNPVSMMSRKNVVNYTNLALNDITQPGSKYQHREKQYSHIDSQYSQECADLVKDHFQDRHNSQVKHTLNNRKKNKILYGNLNAQIQQMQQQQSEMLLSVLTDIRKKKNQPLIVGQSIKNIKLLDSNVRFSQGANGEVIPLIMNGENPFVLQVVPKQQQLPINANLQIEGLTKKMNQFQQAQQKEAAPNLTLQEQQLQKQFFPQYENSPESNSSPSPRLQNSTPSLKSQCSIILAMISSNAFEGATTLLNQLGQIVEKCQTLIKESDQQNAAESDEKQYGNSQSPLNVIKRVLQKKINDMETLRNEEGNSPQETRKIYEDLLEEVSRAIQLISKEQSKEVSNGQMSPIIESPQKQKTFPKNINSSFSGLSPKIIRSLNFAKNQMKSQKQQQQLKIQIYHHPYTHLNDHPINQAIQKINYIIKLIFKQGARDQMMMSMITGNSGSSQNQSTMAQALNAGVLHQLEEAKLSEIHRMARLFNIQIPRKFESKTALREYFSSKEFIIALKTRMNTVLYVAINDSNGFSQSELNYIQGLTNSIQQAPTQNTSDANQGGSYQLSQKFFVGRGNNDALVRSVLKQRSWWMQYTNLNEPIISEEEVISEVSFVWTQWKRQKIIDYLSSEKELPQNSVSKEPGQSLVKTGGPRLRIYNKMEQNKQLTNKKGVFINMREYYRQQGQDPFDVLPLTFLIKAGDINGAEFRRFEDHFAEISQISKQREALRAEALAQRYKELENIKKEQKKRGSIIPRLKGKKPIVKKKAVKESMSDYYDEADDDSDYDGTDDEFEDFEQDDIVREIKRRYKVPKNVWIVKPGENTNRGNGINVSSTLCEIRQLVSSEVENGGKEGETKDKTFIVQKYIDHPLLIHNRKFDFRCYGLMTSINGHLKGYFYEDAYIRTSCKEFDIEKLDNKYIHLTNDAVQKNSQDYGKYENGNKMSLHDFQKYLKHLGNTQNNPQGDSYYSNIDVFRDLMPQIKRLVTDSYRSVYNKIDPERLHNTFEVKINTQHQQLFGYDFMLDEDFKLSLIEVNTNPCLEISCPLLARIIPEVVDNVFRIVLDPLFPSPDLGHNRKCAINEIPQEIKFTLVFDEDIDRPQLVAAATKNSGTKAQVIEEIESDEESDLNEGDEEEASKQDISKAECKITQ